MFKTIYFFIEFIFFNIFVFYYLNNLNIFNKIITLDGLYFSTRYLINVILDINLDFYPFFMKYIYYIVLVCFYCLIQIMLWIDITYNYWLWLFFHYFFIVIASPLIFNELYKNDIIRNWYKNYEYIVFNKILNYTSINLIKHIVKKNLKHDIDITEHELNDIVNNKNIDNVKTFIKICIITTIIGYFKTTNYIGSRFIKYLYKGGMIIDIPKNHISIELDNMEPKNLLLKILEERKWYYLYEPKVLNILISLYNDKNNSFFYFYIENLYISFMKFLTIWTLSNIIYIPILSFLFRIKDKYPKNLIMPLISYLLLIFEKLLNAGNNIILLIIFIDSFVWLLDNIIVHKMLYNCNNIIIKIFNKYTKLDRIILIIKNNYRYLINSIICMPIVSNVNYIEYFFIILISEYKIIYIYNIIFGYLSNYHWGHLFIINIIYNIFYIIYSNSNIQ